MLRTRRKWVYFSVILILSSCGLFEYHPYDAKTYDIEALNAKNIQRIIENDDSSDTLRFIWMGDTQRFYDETKDFVTDVNKRNSNVDFVLHGGDVTDFGLSKEYKWIYDIFEDLTVPYVTLLGNHDAVGYGDNLFEEMFGDYNFSFETHRTRFICLNTNVLEFDAATPVPDFDYMSSFVDDTSSIDNTIVVMHVPPFTVDFNNNSAPLFNSIIESYKNVHFCLNAHIHKLRENDFFDNGIIYYGCDDIAGRNYMLFTVTADTYSYTIGTF